MALEQWYPYEPGCACKYSARRRRSRANHQQNWWYHKRCKSRKFESSTLTKLHEEKHPSEKVIRNDFEYLWIHKSSTGRKPEDFLTKECSGHRYWLFSVILEELGRYCQTLLRSWYRPYDQQLWFIGTLGWKDQKHRLWEWLSKREGWKEKSQIEECYASRTSEKADLGWSVRKYLGTPSERTKIRDGQNHRKDRIGGKKGWRNVEVEEMHIPTRTRIQRATIYNIIHNT